MAEEKKKKETDSMGIEMKKSPLLIYGLLQIPLVLFMVILIIVLYKFHHGASD